jgi:hypothetical protein
MLIERELQALPSQFKVKDDGSNVNLNKLLTAFLLPFQQFSNNISDHVNALLDIENSSGAQLDIIGKLIDGLRESLSDDDFRVYIKLKTKLNNADGTANFTMFAIDKALNTNQNFYIEGTAEVILYLNLKAILTDKQLKILKNTVAAGIKLTIYYTLNEQIYVLSENFTPFLIKDGEEEFLVGVDAFTDNFIVSELSGVNGEPESSVFARSFSIGSGNEDFLIEDSNAPFLITNFDKV